MKAIFVGGEFNKQVMDTEDIVKLEQFNGYTEDLSHIRQAGGCVHRAELDNQPKVYGYLGPMWDGGRLRYETQRVYDMLSN